MRTETCPTVSIRIYISGPIDVAKQIIRRECLKEGLCVTIDPTLFIYTGGEETGYVVTLNNYPRFPLHFEALRERAHALAEILLEETYQHSAMVVSTDKTFWMTKREN